MPEKTVSTTRAQKAGLILLGLGLTLLLLEGALRLGELGVGAVREPAARRSGPARGQYCILCLGESTTARGGRESWPAQLETILNGAGVKGVRFWVVNWGREATESSYIVSALAGDLDRFRPQMVVSMIGINDGDNTVAFSNTPGVRTRLRWGSLRVVRLAHVLESRVRDRWARWTFSREAARYRRRLSGGASAPASGLPAMATDGLQAAGAAGAPAGEPGGDDEAMLARARETASAQEAVDLLNRILDRDSARDDARLELAGRLLELCRWSDAYAQFSILRGKMPGNPVVCRGMGRCLIERGEPAPALPLYRKALEAAPDDFQTLMEAAWVMRLCRRFEEALPLLDRAQKLRPESDWVCVEHGNIGVDRQQYAEALEWFRKALEKNPAAVPIYADMARCLAAMGREDEADAQWSQALAKGLQEPESLMEYARRCLRRGKGREAAAVLEQVRAMPGAGREVTETLADCYRGLGLADKAMACDQEVARMRREAGETPAAEAGAQSPNPDSEGKWIDLGNFWMTLDRALEAEKAFREALRLAPDSRDALVGIARSLRVRQRYDEALEAYLRAGKLDAGDEQVLIETAWVLRLLRRGQEGLPLLRRAMELRPDSDWACAEMANNCMDRGEMREAEKWLRRAVGIQPDRVSLYTDLARCLDGLGRGADTVALWNGALARFPALSPLRVEYGQWLLGQGRYDEAADQFRKAADLDAAMTDAYLGLARCERTRGRLQQACRMYHKVIELQPFCQDAYAEMGDSLRELRQYDQAEAMLRAGLARNPDSSQLYLKLWQCLREMERNGPETEQVLLNAIRTAPGSPDPYIEAGTYYDSIAGRFEEARTMYLKALEKDPLNTVAMVRLLDLYSDQGRAQDSARLIESLLADPRSARLLREGGRGLERLYGYLAVYYRGCGKESLADEYFRKANSIRMQYFPAATRANYRAIRDLVLGRGMKLVCVQYPMRPVEPLRRLFDPGDPVLFVDNEVSFKQALQSAAYGDYFTDHFAGDFGHATARGNALLARNVATVILREAFGRDLEKPGGKP